MERRELEVEGKTIEEAISIAKEKLNIYDEKRLKIEVLEESSSGFLGFIGKKNAKIKVIVEPDYEEFLYGWVNTFLNYAKVEADVKITKKQNRYYISINGKNTGILIGKNGSTLYALEHILTLILNKKAKSNLFVKLDISNYLENRRKKLEELAKRLAKKVTITRKPISLAPMSPGERRIIHNTLRNYRGVYTFSRGVEPKRKVIISPKQFKKNVKDVSV